MSTQPHAALNFAKSEIDKQLSTRGNDEYASADLLVIAVLLADPDWTDRLRSCPWLRIDPNDVAGDVEGRIWFFGAEDGAFGVATLNGRGEVLEQDSIKPAKGFGSDANAWFATSYQRFGGPALELHWRLTDDPVERTEWGKVRGKPARGSTTRADPTLVERPTNGPRLECRR